MHLPDGASSAVPLAPDAVDQVGVARPSRSLCAQEREDQPDQKEHVSYTEADEPVSKVVGQKQKSLPALRLDPQ